jgi:uncharacterized integral membrane protein
MQSPSPAFRWLSIAIIGAALGWLPHPFRLPLTVVYLLSVLAYGLAAAFARAFKP